MNVKAKFFRKKLGVAFILLGLLIFYIIIYLHDAREKSIKDTQNQVYDVWLIFVKVTPSSPLRQKFSDLIGNILNVSSIQLNFNVIVDNGSKPIAKNEINRQNQKYNINENNYKFYDLDECAKDLHDIVSVMKTFFSKPGSYYSDTLFYLSIGLYRIAPSVQKRAILLDCDIYFKKDISILFEEFYNFKSTALFGLAPELTPVYRHVLHIYKSKHNTSFGDFYERNKTSTFEIHPWGYQGYNSGVVLLELEKIRKSKEFHQLLTFDHVKNLTLKYYFKGHLGDQDFYTLIGYDNPHLIQTINCGFNRQLCTWWRDHGYQNVFKHYFKCPHDIVILHGNCNTHIPKY